jgi:subtilisin family serine protease
MKSHHGKSLLSLFILAVIVGLSGTAFGQTYEKYYQDGKIYFKFKDNVTVDIPVNPDRSVDLDRVPMLSGLRSDFEISAMSRPYDLNNDPKLLRTYMLEFNRFEDVEEIMQELSKNSDLEYVEKVPLEYLDYIPDDSLYNLAVGSANWNWHLDVINAVEAWDLNLGSSDVEVAIVDNAVWVEHPDLENKIVLSTNITSPSGNSNPPEEGDPADWSHGTHCAGLVGAETNNGIGVASIGHNVSIIGVRASHSTSPNAITHGYAGIQWAANNGADVISMSWGGPGFSQTNQNIINTIHGQGVVLVGSAGNSNSSQPHYPSSYNHVISVASTNEDDIKSDFSNYGNNIDVSAPGGYGNSGPQGLMSSTYEETSHGYYNTYFGTSMSTPLTAGLIGLILSVNPDLTPDEVEEVLESTCVNIDTIPGNASWSGMLGAGRVDAYAAVMNTPFDPTADFYTPVPYITPGTTIQFFDMSSGVPDEWSWECPGGTPYLSNVQNPEVTYDEEGIYTVYLGVTNDFGTDVETKNNYITVTSTPHPWPLFTAGTDYTCAYETVAFIDQSLYDPTSWLWEFEPNTVSFVDGTSETSQDPLVVFETPGYYTVTLTAVNENGSGTLTKEDVIFVEGIELNFAEDFEAGETSSFDLFANPRAKVTVDNRAAAPESSYGLHFQGGGQVSGWTGGPFNTTPEQAWNSNIDFHGFASNCNVDATGIDGISLLLDLRQTYSIGPTYSWFRVLVNDEPVQDVNGMENFNPTTNTDPFVTKTFDLSAHGNTMFTLTLQSSCYLLDGFYAGGDNVFVDNIMITNNTSLNEDSQSAAGVLTYPNPAMDVLNFSANGIGNNAVVKIMNTKGQVVYSKKMRDQDGTVDKIMVGNLPSGIYLLQISGDKGMATKKFIKK